jgi:hypothetical protein
MATVVVGGQERTLRYGFLAFRKLAERGVVFVPKVPSPEVLWAPETQIKILWAGCLADAPDVTVEDVQAWLDPLEFDPAVAILATALMALLAAWEGEQRRPPSGKKRKTSSGTPNGRPTASATAPGSSSG